MKRVFISGGITGVADYMERFRAAEEQLKRKGYKVINPTVVSEHLLDADADWNDFMVVTQALLAICDSIYMLRGWEQSAGAAVEHKIALETNKCIIYETEEYLQGGDAE